MADNGTIDFGQIAGDETFQKMPLAQQSSYLSSVDKTFAGMTPTQQSGYIAHILAPERQARAAQPTQFERNVAEKGYDPSQGGWRPIAQHAADFAQGVPEGMLQTVGWVSRGLHALPGGETLAPEKGITAMSNLSTAKNPWQQMGKGAEHVGETLALMGGPTALEDVPAAARAAVKPLIRGAIGSAAGGYGGREIGKLFGMPEMGEKVGTIAGGLYGGFGGKIPSRAELFHSLLSEEPEAETATAVKEGAKAPTLVLTPDEAVSEPAVQQRLEFPKEQAAPKAAAKGWAKMPEAEAPTGKPDRMATQEISRMVDEATGNAPAVKGVPLREQPRLAAPAAKAAEAEAAPKTLAEKYPDKAARQMVHANGEEMYEAAKGNPETLKAVHSLDRVQLRQALINAGEDMGQTTVSNSRFAGEGSITREQAFHRLLEKGYSPEEIVELAKKDMSKITTLPANGGRLVMPVRETVAPSEYEAERVAAEEGRMKRSLASAARERARRIRAVAAD